MTAFKETPYPGDTAYADVSLRKGLGGLIFPWAVATIVSTAFTYNMIAYEEQAYHDKYPTLTSTQSSDPRVRIIGAPGRLLYHYLHQK